MITGEIKSNVGKIWDMMWSGGIEQLTYLLFIKRLDELHTLKERKANRTYEGCVVYDADGAGVGECGGLAGWH